MKPTRLFLTVALLSALGVTPAMADCQIADAKLEEAILQKPELRGPAHRQSVRDLRSLRDAAFTLWSYGRHADCERLLANIRELIAGPAMASLGDNDEDEAEKQFAAREPKVQRGAALGRRDEKGAKPLIAIDELAPGLRADEIMGAEVRSSDDKIVGEVRNIVFGTKDRRDYAIVASGGFFTPGKDSIVVPIRFLKVSPERDSFFLSMPQAEVKTIPLMPDPDYKWLSDEAWRTRNDALFARP
jgi:PRC-barrel domain protein